MKSISVALFVFLSLSTAFAATGDSKVTPIVGATLVCSDQTAFLAFNFVSGRIWLGEGGFRGGIKGIELDAPRFQKEKNTIGFTGSIKITWGNDIYQNVVAGKIFADKKPVQALITMTPAAGGLGKTKTVACR